MFIRSSLIALLTLATIVQAIENPTIPTPERSPHFTLSTGFDLPYQEEISEEANKEETKTAFYGSAATLLTHPGLGFGVSIRHPKTYSTDIDLHSLIVYHWVTASASKILPWKELDANNYNYVSIGWGGMGALITMPLLGVEGFVGPIFPLRAGTEWNSGFIDIGFIPGLVVIPGSGNIGPYASLQFRCCFKF